MGNVIKEDGVTKLLKIAASLRKANTRMGIELQRELRAQTEFILSKLKALSPNESGHFAGNWHMDRRYVSSKTNAITSIRVYNSTKLYGAIIEGGSTPGNSPWPSVPKTKAKTVMSQGRIWSSTAPGGTVAQITDADLRSMQTALLRRGVKEIGGVFR